MTGPRSWRRRLSLRAQLVVVTALLAALVGCLLVVIVQLTLAGAASSTTQGVLDDRVASLTSGIDGATSGSRPTVPDTDLGPGVAVFDASGDQVAGSVPPSMHDIFAELATTNQRRFTENGDQYAVLAAPFATSSGARGVVVVTEPITPYERSEDAALLVSICSAVLLVLMAAGSAWWISGRVMRPVEEMARTAEEWSEHDLERRFDLGPPTDEIRALGRTLDGLLDKVAAAIRAEQRLTSELAHELRTPLTTIRGTADLLAMRSDLDEEARTDVESIRSTSDTMSTTIRVLLDVARRDGRTGRAAADGVERTRLADLAVALDELALPPGRVEIDLPDGIVEVPRALATRAVAPLLANALAVSQQVRVTGRVREGRVDLVVQDDGPGVPTEWVDALFEPGWSGTGGSGLGLALARRVARSGGGDVRLAEPQPARGALFVASFPGAR